MRRPSPTLLWWLGTGLVSAALLVVTVSVTVTVYDVPLLVAFIAGTAQCAALPLALVRPLNATLLQFAGVIIFSLAAPVDPTMTWPLTVPGMITLIVHVGLIAARDQPAGGAGRLVGERAAAHPGGAARSARPVHHATG